MRSRNSKGQFIKKSSERAEKTQKGGKYKDSKGRWHSSATGKYTK